MRTRLKTGMCSFTDRIILQIKRSYGGIYSNQRMAIRYAHLVLFAVTCLYSRFGESNEFELVAACFGRLSQPSVLRLRILTFPPFERIPNPLIIILDKTPPRWYSSLDFGLARLCVAGLRCSAGAEPPT